IRRGSTCSSERRHSRDDVFGTAMPLVVVALEMDSLPNRHRRAPRWLRPQFPASFRNSRRRIVTSSSRACGSVVAFEFECRGDNVAHPDIPVISSLHHEPKIVEPNSRIGVVFNECLDASQPPARLLTYFPSQRAFQ